MALVRSDLIENAGGTVGLTTDGTGSTVFSNTCFQGRYDTTMSPIKRAALARMRPPPHLRHRRHHVEMHRPHDASWAVNEVPTLCCQLLVRNSLQQYVTRYFQSFPTKIRMFSNADCKGTPVREITLPYDEEGVTLVATGHTKADLYTAHLETHGLHAFPFTILACFEQKVLNGFIEDVKRNCAILTEKMVVSRGRADSRAVFARKKLVDRLRTMKQESHIFLRRLDENDPVLTELNLANTDVGVVLAKQLSESITRNRVLVDLFLEQNHLGDKGTVCLAGALPHTKTLKRLFLCGCLVGDEGAVALAACLGGPARRQNTSLETLDLAENEIGDEGSQAFGRALQNHELPGCPLRSLSLRNNERIGTEGFKMLFVGIKHNLTVLSITTDSNKVRRGRGRSLLPPGGPDGQDRTGGPL